IECERAEDVQAEAQSPCVAFPAPWMGRRNRRSLSRATISSGGYFGSFAAACGVAGGYFPCGYGQGWSSGGRSDCSITHSCAVHFPAHVWRKRGRSAVG